MELPKVVKRILAGDRQAFAEVVTTYQGPLFGYLGRMGLPQTRAEEVAQEAFLRAWTRLADFDPGRGSFSTWLYTIAHRLALNELGRSATRQELAMVIGHDPASDAPGPADALATVQRRQRLQAALLDLPARERAAVALAYIADLALAEVARIEGCSVGAIKTRLHRARRRLATLLENDSE
jgi:RNA polymerase sigma-70 factor (ECF subfamily)